MRIRLDISPGWAICYNQFADEDPVIVDGEIENWDAFKNSLAQFVKMELVKGHWRILDEHLLIDMGWYPEADPNGCYKAVLVNHTEGDWEDIDQFESQDRFEVRDKIEEWMRVH